MLTPPSEYSVSERLREGVLFPRVRAASSPLPGEKVEEQLQLEQETEERADVNVGRLLNCRGDI